MIKMVNRFGRITEGAKKAFEGAFICGPFNECIRVPGMIECDRTGCREALEDISRVAAYEFSWIVKGFAEADKD